MPHALQRVLQGSGQPRCSGPVVLQQMEGHALRGLHAHTRQAAQGVDQAFERGFGHAESGATRSD